MTTSWPARQPHQARALAALAEAYQYTDRAQLHWACGTGKTFVGRWLAEDLDADTTVVFVPSLALIAQALAEWQTASDWPFDAIVVCSDSTAADTWRIDPGWWTDHGVTVTTDSAPVTAFLTGRRNRPRVVFSTYHSAPVVSRACRRARARFDLVVCDEAHRLAGRPDDRFRLVLDDRDIRARRRLFATATPVTAERGGDLLSMTDTAVFGPVADRLDFAQAIAAGLLADYQILVLDAAGDARDLDAATAVPAALAAAAREGLTRVISFHSRVAAARQFATSIDGLSLPDGRTARAHAVAGTDPSAQRQQVLAQLEAGAENTVTVVSNARCLTEGVNVPSVDGVIFADPKTSDTDIVQAIGRALRPAPGKTRGLIILPVVVPDGAEEEALTGGAFAAVWGVLRAMRSLDPRMAAALERPAGWTTPGRARTGGAPAVLRFELGGVDLDRIVARLVEPSDGDEAWRDSYDQLGKWVAEHGHAAVPWAASRGGQPVGRWVVAQRRAYMLGALAPSRVGQLNAVPGWGWTADMAWWNADHAAVLAAAGRRLDLEDPDVGGRRMPHRHGKVAAVTVGRWCAKQRIALRDGDLDEHLAARCEDIPGWSWTGGIAPREQRLVDALAEWVEGNGDANVPHQATWGAQPLGAFITAVRRKAVTGRLPLPLADEIAVVTPPKAAPGALDWRADDTRWELHLIALRQFAERTGGCNIPEHGTERLGGYDFRIYQWASRQRHWRRHGHLDDARARLLDQVPGWAWERTPAARVVVGIGARQHGTRAGYAAGCRCEACTAANSAYEVDRDRRRAAGAATTDLVDAAGVRGHLRTLEARVGRRARPAMRDVTGFNKKTIDEVINGGRARVRPEVDEALRALTVEDLLAHIEADPSPRDDIPAGPTLALIDELLAAGWTKAWISREIGGDGRALQVGRTASGVVRRETAEAVAGLHARVGGRRAPDRGCRSGLPSLADILTSECPAVAA
jgi:superfamily II DNA or RNA helicase